MLQAYNPIASKCIYDISTEEDFLRYICSQLQKKLPLHASHDVLLYRENNTKLKNGANLVWLY